MTDGCWLGAALGQPDGRLETALGSSPLMCPCSSPAPPLMYPCSSHCPSPPTNHAPDVPLQFTLPITAHYSAMDPALVPPLEQLAPAGEAMRGVHACQRALYRVHHIAHYRAHC